MVNKLSALLKLNFKKAKDDKEDEGRSHKERKQVSRDNWKSSSDQKTGSSMRESEGKNNTPKDDRYEDESSIGYQGKINPEKMQSIVDSHEDNIRNSDAKNPEEVIEHLLRMHAIEGSNPHAFIAGLMNHRGISSEEIDPLLKDHLKAPIKNMPAYPNIEIEIEPSEGSSKVVSSEEEISPEMIEKHAREAKDAFDKFKSSGDRKHLEKVAPMMSAIFSDPSLSDHGEDMESAYENASWAHPDVRKEMMEGINKEKDVKKAIKSSSSIRPQGKSEEKESDPKNFREAFKRNFDKARR